MFTFMSLWTRPYWDLMDYHVTLRYEDGSGAPPVHLEKEGTIDVGADSTPEEMLLHLARVLEQGARATQAERRAIAP